MQKIKRFISVFTLAAMLFNLMPNMTREAYAVVVTPQQVNDAATKFADAVGKFSAKSAAEQIGKVANFCNRLGGLTSAAAGVIGILQMTGVIKDPTMQMLEQVIGAIKDVQTTLENMNKSLNQIAQELISIQTAQQEIDRNNKATLMSTNWNNFNTNYTEKLKTYLNEYDAKINSGIKEWWEQTSHEGVYVLITLSGDEHLLTYSKQDYSAGLPEKSEINNEIVNKEWSIGIPAGSMPDTSAVTFNINTYRDDFKKLMVTALKSAAESNKLDSNCGASFKSDYSTMLETYAENVLNTVIYKIACKVMTKENSWVAQVISTYKHYCDNILQRDSGINAFLNYIYLTHAFEGEVSEDIEKFCDAMTAQVGFYGEFALTCAGQDNLQSTANKEELRDYFVNTVIKIVNTKAKAITGFNNYCYITGTRLEADTMNISSKIYVNKSDAYTYEGCKTQPWTVTVPSIVNSVYMPIIYKQYTKLPQGANSFGAYLNKYGAQKDSNNKTYMTNYRGVETFAFSEGIYMRAYTYSFGGTYFKSGNWYHIDVGTGSKVEQKYYRVHDKVMGDWFNSSNGSLSANVILAARALYGESHWTWTNDEAWVFASEGVNMRETNGYRKDLYANFDRTVDILKSRALHNLNGDESSDPDNPFFAWDNASLVDGVSDYIGDIYQTTSKDITEVLLEGESFPYTGQPIEPAVMVLASDDVLSEDCYTVDYMDNVEAGKNAMVIVEGIGDYTGVIAKYFTILSADSSSNSSSELNVYGSSSSGCNAMSSMFIALGLGFIFLRKKLHRP